MIAPGAGLGKALPKLSRAALTAADDRERVSDRA
jgi:hypothetical protein